MLHTQISRLQLLSAIAWLQFKYYGLKPSPSKLKNKSNLELQMIQMNIMCDNNLTNFAGMQIEFDSNSE